MMKESLEKKLEILHRIEQKNIDQHNVLMDPNADPDDFEVTVDAKTGLIEEIEKLDEGFEKLFSQVEDELKINKDRYKDDIERMQELIGVPVVVVSTLTGAGIDSLLRLLRQVASRPHSYAHPVVHGW